MLKNSKKNKFLYLLTKINYYLSINTYIKAVYSGNKK